MNKKIYFHSLFLILVLVTNHFLHFDFYVQNWFYHHLDKKWIIDAEEPIMKMIFYKGIKWSIIVFGGALVLIFLFNLIKKKSFKSVEQLDRLQVILSLALVPAFISFLKSSTHMHCPEELSRFNGSYPYILLFQSHPTDLPFGKCFPAGHASGGFSLLVFGFTQKKFKFGIWVGLLLGWIMGLYQMMKGDHFLTHTLVTQSIAFIFNHCFYLLRQKYFSEETVPQV